VARGSCLCGAIQLEVTGPIEEVGNCHCSMCRRTHGAPFSTFARVARGDLVLRSGQGDVRTYASSEQVERSFCGVCGARLFFRWSGLPSAVWVAAGLFEDDASLRPQYHMFVGSKASWDEIGDRLPQYEKYPPVASAD
jgi:hypothetical protein